MTPEQAVLGPSSLPRPGGGTLAQAPLRGMLSFPLPTPPPWPVGEAPSTHPTGHTGRLTTSSWCTFQFLRSQLSLVAAAGGASLATPHSRGQFPPRGLPSLPVCHNGLGGLPSCSLPHPAQSVGSLGPRAKHRERQGRDWASRVLVPIPVGGRTVRASETHTRMKAPLTQISLGSLPNPVGPDLPHL